MVLVIALIVAGIFSIILLACLKAASRDDSDDSDSQEG